LGDVLKEGKPMRPGSTNRLTIAAAALLLLMAGCATKVAGGPRPPQGPGAGGTEFGFWDRDAEGAVDAGFRRYVTDTYDIGDVAAARTTLEKDGFSCQDGNRPEGRPVPQLECERLFQLNDEVHAWTVEFWADEREPRAHYTRTHIRDPFRTYDGRSN
jgi:hypothetical protein